MIADWLGDRAGDRVGLLCPPGLDFVRLAHAIPRAGGILIPLRPASSAVGRSGTAGLIEGKNPLRSG